MGRLIERIEAGAPKPSIATMSSHEPDTKKDIKIPWRTDKLSTYSKKSGNLFQNIRYYCHILTKELLNL
jgi:hypothetical protein